MGEDSNIAWCSHTFNPWLGCAKISAGCKNCYAETWGTRFNIKWGLNGDRRRTKTWSDPIRWNKAAKESGIRQRVFCASLADVFESDSRLDEFRKDLFPLIEKCDSLDWLLLTKRPENMLSMVPWKGAWPKHVWALTTAENQEMAERRASYLVKVPASVRGLSCEPLLGPLDISKEYMQDIDWVIAGCESGAGRRPFDIEWARSLKQQSDVAKAAFFMKQIPKEGNKKGVTDNMDDFPEDLRVREFPNG